MALLLLSLTFLWLVLGYGTLLDGCVCVEKGLQKCLGGLVASKNTSVGVINYVGSKYV